ncbi:KPN_02809 family neutral zinc metallopeptidase [Pseudoduganella chitinolytica]|uniref:Zinc metallopeptidase n=1 Tax=Pseudoduganella chitinolytica TaxID=34070 RepID=A0ABY8B559_9BURK|nr:neutral zinc metallopeptidase [Pseudoduganella chitinolytica]WEF31080.1 zinc metallopeptidase [Pseudoduganella chitinolytica]
MRWEGNRESDNVEDRRGDSSGGGGGFRFGGGSLGIGGVIVALVLSYVLGVSPSTILGLMSGGGAPQQQVQTRTAPANDETTRFVRTVLADTEDVWGNLFRQQGEEYARPTLVLFSGRTPTACGTGQSATGPFYCPPDRKVYIDLDFFKLMQQRFHVSGEFAEAYVIAHEIGHHVQNLMGLSDKVHNAQQRMGEAEANALSVRLELQADCFAGVWAFHANRSRQILEQGDVETALSAATAIGDDALQRQAQGHVVPDSFTHGTSAQRVRWFRKGIDSGEIAQCDTFSARQL